MRWFRRTFIQVGLDIQPHEIRLLKLQHKPRGAKVLKMARSPLPRGVIEEDKIHQFSVVQTCLAELVKEMGALGLMTAIALPWHLTKCKKISSSNAAFNLEQNADLAGHLAAYFPQFSGSFCVDLVKRKGPSARPDDFLLFAARQEHILPYLNLARDAGLNINIIDIDLYALVRTVHLAEGLNGLHLPYMVLYGRRGLSQLIAIAHEEIIFYRHFVSIEDLTFEIKLKEIEEALAIEHGPIHFDKIILIGEVQMNANIVTALEQHFNLKAIHLDKKASPVPSDYLIAYGLALRGLS